MSVDARIKALWEHADKIAFEIADHNSRAKFIYWLFDPSTPQQTKDLIMQIQAAMDYIWQKYYQDKQILLSGGQPTPFIIPSNIPTFFEVVESLNS
jgi:hypothetical protein